MLFLLNDVVFDLDEACPATPADARRFEQLSTKARRGRLDATTCDKAVWNRMAA